MPEKRARLLVSSPIEERLQALRERAEDHEKWGADGVARAIRLCIAEVEDAVENASEARANTMEASRLSGWAVGTLQKYAKMRMDGRRVPHAWRGLQVEIDGGGDYVFTVSTIPVHAKERSA